MDRNDRDVVVIGGGISGLTAAWQLKKAGLDVCLLEDQTEVGGCTRSELRDGFLLEKGPFNVIVRDAAFETLLEEFADVAGVVSADPSSRKRFIYRRGRILAVPSNPVALATTPLLSMTGKARLLAGLVASRRGTLNEETIEQVAVRRFGPQVADTFVSAVVAGIFAGDIRRLSMPACFPAVVDFDRRARSPLGYGIRSMVRARRQKKGRKPRRWPGLISIDGGLGALTGAIGKRLGPDSLIHRRVESIRRLDGAYEVATSAENDKTASLRCRQVVLAVSAVEAARLLKPLAQEATGILETIVSTSLVVLNLGYRTADVGHPMQGYGFLVPHDEPDFPLLGVLWADSVFPHHAPDGHRLIRVFVGGSRDPGAAGRSDEELLDIASGALGDLLQIRNDPVLVDISKYASAIPQYHLGHVEKIGRLHAALAPEPGLHLVGNYLTGVSINDTIRLATRTAAQIVQGARSADLDAAGAPQNTAQPVGSS